MKEGPGPGTVVPGQPRRAGNHFIDSEDGSDPGPAVCRGSTTSVHKFMGPGQ